MTMKFAAGALVFLALLSICLSKSQAIYGQSAWPTSHNNQSQALDQKKGSGFNIGVWLASLFRDHLSAVDGNRCPSIPSCSSYSVEAFRKHGFFVGWVMTVDRLIHEADEGSASPISKHSGEGKIMDPVENNDFWWFDPHEKDPQ